jgi:S1-C subfamily serine protease
MNGTAWALVITTLVSCAMRPASADSGPQPGTTPKTTPIAVPPYTMDPRRLVHGDVYFRTFRIRPKGAESFGTGFLMQVDGREYLVTAAHVVAGFKKTLQLWRLGGWSDADAKLVGSAAPKIDITVLVLEGIGSAPPALYDFSGDTYLSEQLFFVGFPYGLSTNLKLNVGYPIPFIKTGILSGWLTDEGGQASVGMYLDAINNPGFSGGPVVLPGLPVRIVGVVSGYQGAPSEVLGPAGKHLVDPTGKPLGLYTQENTGLLAAYSIRFALDLIHKNPIGTPVIAPAAQK